MCLRKFAARPYPSNYHCLRCCSLPKGKKPFLLYVADGYMSAKGSIRRYSRRTCRCCLCHSWKLAAKDYFVMRHSFMNSKDFEWCVTFKFTPFTLVAMINFAVEKSAGPGRRPCFVWVLNWFFRRETLIPRRLTLRIIFCVLGMMSDSGFEVLGIDVFIPWGRCCPSSEVRACVFWFVASVAIAVVSRLVCPFQCNVFWVVIIPVDPFSDTFRRSVQISDSITEVADMMPPLLAFVSYCSTTYLCVWLEDS